MMDGSVMWSFGIDTSFVNAVLIGSMALAGSSVAEAERLVSNEPGG